MWREPTPRDTSPAPSNHWATIGTLAATQTISWGVLYYTFPVLLVPMAKDLDASPAALSGAFSVALLAAGFSAPPVGRWIDRHGARMLMTAGSVTAALAVVAWAATPNIGSFYLVSVVVGIAMASTLYEPALAVVAHYLPDERRRAILIITVTAALASTVFSPLAGGLAERFGWRTSLVALAAFLLVSTVPLHALALPRPPPVASTQADTGRATFRRSSSFRTLTIAFAVEKAVATAVAAHIVIFLVDQGESLGRAAMAAGLIGVAKIVGRVGATVATRHRSALSLSSWAFGLQALALAAPFLDPEGGLGIVVLVGVFGATSGAATVLWPLTVMERFGTAAFGRMGGTGAVAAAVPKAMAPGAVGLAVANGGSYSSVWIGMAVLAAGASAACRRASHR